MANIYGLILARHQKFPKVKTEGIGAMGHLVSFVSEDAHYSFVKGSIWMGMGSQSVIKVPVDSKGRMQPQLLDKAIQKVLFEGKSPYLVAATAGTTVLGSFDSIREISQVSQKYGLWLHVDAALGGTVLFSRTHRHLMAGVEDADSVSWNLHKLAVGHQILSLCQSLMLVNPRECPSSARPF